MMQTSSRRGFLAAIGAALVSPRVSWGANEVPVLLDHILLGCSDLDRGVAFIEQRLGVRAALGGVHPGRGTQNALVSLGSRHYLEIIAPDPQQAGVKLPQALELQQRSLLGLKEPRLVAWAAHPGNLDDFAARLRNAGIAFQGPQPGSRKRPDGRVLQWRTLNLQDDHGGVLPFFIEWGADTVHPSADAPQGAKLVRFSIADPSPAKLESLCKAMGLHVVVEESQKPRIRARLSGRGGKSATLTS
jgi:catechol 2,3-dioxygenase-like lactoylglutathione lyase family enzyme